MSIAKREDRPTGKSQIAMKLDAGLVDRMRDVVYWERMTLVQFIEEAIQAKLKTYGKVERRPEGKELKRGPKAA